MEPATGSRPHVRLTDQATVAARLAASLAGADRATVAHLVAGLAGESEGRAGTVLRQRFGEVAPRIALHPAVAARALPALETAYVALPVQARPCWTLEVLEAARRVGGEDLAYLLTDCGVGLEGFADDLVHVMPTPQQAEEEPEGPETYGRMSLLPREFTDAADAAIARARARGGDSRDLLAWLDADEPTANALANAPAVPLDVVVAAALRRGGPIDGTALIAIVTTESLRLALDGRR